MKKGGKGDFFLAKCNILPWLCVIYNKVMIRRLFLFLIVGVAMLVACSDDDTFSTNSGDRLSFAVDTLSFDTIFSSVPTSTQSFWVHNNSGDGLRISRVSLEHGNQRGFRVNVDGNYLDNTAGSLAQNIEVRKGDSIRVFVELTTVVNGNEEPTLVEDNLVFRLESGVEQKVNLRAFSWDALSIDSLAITSDTTIASTKPILIGKGITVAEGATLTINAPTKLYFHAGKGIEVFGQLIVEGTPDNNVVMRGDRTDRMFDYLPYDRVSGQWGGIAIRESSNGNVVRYADIHSGSYGIVCDSAALDTISPRLTVDCSTIHNVSGNGVEANNAYVKITNSQISNAAGDCVAIHGGKAEIIYCTLAQFYPFTGGRGVALSFSNSINGNPTPLYILECTNTIVTGYSSDEFMGSDISLTGDTTNGGESNEEIPFNYIFTNSIIRTPTITDEEALAKFPRSIFEQADSTEATSQFVGIDEDNLIYDFHLDSAATARKKALPLEVYPYDRNNVLRGEEPNIGCFE